MEMELLSATSTESSTASVSERIEAASEWVSVVFGNLLSVKRVFSCVELGSHLIISKHFKGSSNVKPLLFRLFELFFRLKLLINISHHELSVYRKFTYGVRVIFRECIGMRLGRLFSVGFLDFLLFRFSVDAEDLVVITLF